MTTLGRTDPAAGVGYPCRVERDVAAVLDDPDQEPGPDGPDPAGLFARLPGYWPLDVLAALDRRAAGAAGARATAAGVLARRLRTGTGDDPDHGDQVRLMLPVPHPLDADWRFAAQARERLLERAAAAAPGGCVLLGTPTLFAHVCGQLDLRGIVLVDRSAETVKAARRLADGHELLRVVQADLSYPGGHGGLAAGTAGTAGVVVADPPWYKPEQAGFLRAAARALAPGGTLLMAASPTGSRPTGQADRDELLRDAAACGLRLEEIAPSELPYSSPPFERAALAAAGAPGTPTGWRSADLLVLRRDRSGEPPAAPALPARPPWREAAAGRVRVKALERPCAAAMPSIGPGVAGAVSTTVSRRSADRNAANVWTTGNGAWMAAGDGAVSLALTSVTSGQPRMAGGQDLLDALAAEQAHLREWGWA